MLLATLPPGTASSETCLGLALAAGAPARTVQSYPGQASPPRQPNPASHRSISLSSRTTASGSWGLWGHWVRAGPPPHRPQHQLPWQCPCRALLCWLFALGAPGGCWDLLGRLWSARPAGCIAGCPCWALCGARGACEEENKEQRCLVCLQQELGHELTVCPLLMSWGCCVPAPAAAPCHSRMLSLALDEAEQSPFSSAAPWQRRAGSATSAQAASSEGRGWPQAPGPAPGPGVSPCC